MNDKEALGLNKAHIHACHERWYAHKNRSWPDDQERPDEWYAQQCGGCRYYIPLQGLLKTDWGVCSNAATLLDGKVMFEHDGCDAYDGADEWVGGYYDDYERSLLKNYETRDTAVD